MMGPDYRAFISRAYGGGHRLYVSWDDPDFTKRGPSGGRLCYVANGFEKTTCEEGDNFDYEHGIRHADGLIQAIVNEAWERGFRPSGFSDVKNETTAIRSHLADMRAIVAKKVGVEWP